MRALKGLFWRMAHRWYHYRDPSRWWEYSWYFFAACFALMWVFALVTNWAANQENLFKAPLLVGAPLLIGLALRKIRSERHKGSDALWRKRVTYNG